MLIAIVAVWFQRNTIKRMCIKTLPPLLCIQLKRFGYDWEANRALKFDDFFKVLPICLNRMSDNSISVCFFGSGFVDAHTPVMSFWHVVLRASQRDCVMVCV